MECEECHTIKAQHEFYRLANGRLTRVDVCRSCRRAKDAPDSPPARANEATDR